MNKAINQIVTTPEGSPGNGQGQESFKGEHLYALMLKLRALSGGELLPHSGQLAHAALLHWFAEVDAAFATRLHEPNLRRPFTCSSLWFTDGGESAGRQQAHRRLVIRPDHTYWLRFTLLTESLFQTFMTRFFQMASPTPTLQVGSGLPKIRLGNAHFDVVEAMTAPSVREKRGMLNWSSHATYSDLVERAQSLDATKGDVREIELEFRSPTAFSNGQRGGGKQMHLFPDLDRVFDSLARSWNTWTPAVYAIDVQALLAYMHEWVTIASYDLHTQTAHFDRTTQSGFMGRCVYVLLEAGQASRRSSRQAVEVGAGLSPVQTLHLLSEFAFYAGVGYKTAMGMGQTRCLT